MSLESLCPFHHFLRSSSPHNLSIPSLVHFCITMATYPEISAVDFSVRIENGQPVQNQVYVHKYAYQHTSNFDQYKPADEALIPYEGIGPKRYTLRRSLANCYWETVQMKIKYILAAAHNWNGQTATVPLPTTLSKSKLTEIGMPPPLFPHTELLTINFFLSPEKPEVIREWVDAWQAQSLNLSAWIAQARLNSMHTENCTWVWPPSPFGVYPLGYPDDANPDQGDESGSLFDKSTSSTPEEDSPHSTDISEPSSLAANSLHISTDPRPTKRIRTVSLEPEPNNLQVVVWQPTPLQRWERERELREKEWKEQQARVNANQPLVPPTPSNTPVQASPSLSDTAISSTDRPIHPLPIRAMHATSRGPLSWEYESRTVWQENKGKILFE